MKADAGGRVLWVWLFPLTYVAHVAEEWWGGFPAWASRLFGARLTDGAFWSINGVGVLVFGVAAAVLTGGIAVGLLVLLGVFALASSGPR